MNKKFTLGRTNDNDIRIDKNFISKTHLEIEYINDNTLFIKDLNSTNGTYLLDKKGIKRKIKEKQIDINDIVYLGSSYKLEAKNLMNLITKKINADKTDFSKEFYTLKPIYDEYDTKLEKLTKKYKTKPLLIRLFLTVLLMIATLIFGGKLQEYRYFLMTGIGMSGGFLATNSSTNKKYRAQKEDLILELQKKYKCPKCKKNIPIDKSWSYYHRLGYCPACKANWS